MEESGERGGGELWMRRGAAWCAGPGKGASVRVRRPAAVNLQRHVQPPWDGWTSARREGEEELAAAPSSAQDREKVLGLFSLAFDRGCPSPHWAAAARIFCKSSKSHGKPPHEEKKPT